jgi:predicted membrane-bound mannosyltransferase
MNPDDVEGLLRQTGRPFEPPARLRRAVLRVPTGPGQGRRPRVWRTRIAAAAAAAVLLVTASAVVVQQVTSFHAVAAVTLRGAPGTNALAEVGQPDGPNRPVRLVVQHLKPGAVSYYELWSLAEHPPMMLTTFMTDTSGSCTLTFSMPASASWRDLAVTPEGESSSYLLRSDR